MSNAAWCAPEEQQATHEKFPVSLTCSDAGCWRCAVNNETRLEVEVRSPLGVRDSYSRGDDFVATHTPTRDFPFRTQLYWSAKSAASFDGFAVLLTVSLQTNKLDSQPTIELTLHAKDCVAVLEGGATVSAADGMALAPFPSDLPECKLSPGPDRTTLRFAPPFLEKGVIRRSRFALLIGKAAVEPGTLRDALAELAAGPLPLTT